MSNFTIRRPIIEHLEARAGVVEFPESIRATIIASADKPLGSDCGYRFQVLIDGGRTHDSHENLSRLADAQAAIALEAIASELRKRAAD